MLKESDKVSRCCWRVESSVYWLQLWTACNTAQRDTMQALFQPEVSSVSAMPALFCSPQNFSSFLTLISPETVAPFGLFIILFPISLSLSDSSIIPPPCSRQRPVAVSASSEARLTVAAGRGWRAREHHNVRWWGRRRGRHRRLWHCCAAERPPQLTLSRLPHLGQQEHVSPLTRH